MYSFLLTFCLILKIDITNGFEFRTSSIAAQNLTNFVERACPTDWEPFQRPKGLFCIRVYSAPPYVYTQSIAQALCNQEGAYLTGIESIEEHSYIQQKGMQILQANDQDRARLWLGLVRTSNCRGATETANNNLNCAISRYTFYWADPMVSNRIFTEQWADNQPDYNNNNQDCAQMYLTQPAGITGFGPIGFYDDATCGTATNSYYTSTALYACGMRAPIVRFVNSPM